MGLATAIFVSGQPYSDGMLIDCNSCVMRDVACGECVVTMLLGPIPESLEEHRDALSVLADAGIVAPLRLIRGDGNNEQVQAACQ